MTNSKPITAKDDRTDFQLPSFADEERYLRTIIDSIPSGVVVIDAETRRIVDANPAALKMIGAAKDNVIGAICHQFICPAAQGQCPICDLGQSVDNSERVLLTAQGSVIPIIKNVVTITFGSREYLIESFVDISRQKQTEDELRMLSRAVEQSTNTVIITDTNGIIEYVNPRFTQTTGYTPAEVVGQHSRILKSDETPTEAYQELWDTITSGQIWRGEFRNKKKNGDLYWESVAISPVTDETGQIRHFLSMKEEITARKQAEDALRRSEEQFRAILETTPVPTLVSRVSDGMVLYANDPIGEMFGATTESLVGNITPDFYYDRADRQIIAEKIKQEGRLKNFELKVKKFDGTLFWTIASMQTMVYGGEAAVMVGFSDITERKRLEDELAQERNLLRAVIDNLPDYIYVKDTQGRFLLVNKLFERLLGGATADEIVGKTDFDFFPPELAEQYHTNEQELLQSGQPMIGREEPVIDPGTGIQRWMSTSKAPFYDSQGKIGGLVGLSRDITERKQAEEKIKASEEKFRTLFESTGDAVMVLDEKGFIDCNPQTLKMFGYQSYAEFLNTHPAEQSPPLQPDGRDSKTASNANIAIAMKEGSVKFEWLHRRANGNVFLAEVLLTAMELEGKSVLQAVIRDITQRKQAEEMLTKRAVELETVAQVGAAASTILDTEALLQQVVDLTKERFNLYHAHIYLLDDITNKLNLSAGAGDVGRKMAAQGWSIPLEREHSLVARAARTRQGVTVNDVRQEPGFFPNPLLPDTRSELAVPLIAGDTVLGVLDVQADKVDYFTEQDAQIQSTLASQVAVALQNARLFVEQKKNSLLLQERVKGLNLLNEIGQETDEVPPIPRFLQWVTERIPAAMQYAELCIVAIEFDGQIYGQPKAIDLPTQVAYGLYIGGQLEGRLYTAYTEKREFINEESAMLGAVATRVSGYIENRRLFESTQTALARTENLYKSSEQIVRAKTVDEVLVALVNSSILRQLDRANIMLFDRAWGDNPPKTMTVEAVWERSGTPEFPAGATYQPEQMPSISNLSSGEPFIARDVETDKRLDNGTKVVMKNLGIHGFLAFQLKVGNQWFGALIGQSYHPLRITDEQIRQLNALVEQAAIVVQSQRLLQQTQAALEEANFLRRAVEQSLDGSAVADMTGNILFANPAWVKMHGYDHADELLGQPLNIFHTKEQLQNEVEAFNVQVMKRGAYQGEVGHKRKDGTTFSTWMTVTVLLDADGNPAGLSAFAQDITERKKLEESLKENEALYESLLNAIPQNLYRVDRKGRIVFANKAYLNLMGMSLEEIKGKTTHDLVPREMVDKYDADDRYVMQSGKIFEDVEIHKERTTGKTVYVQVVKSPVRDWSGKIIGLQGIFWDITEQKEAELERERLLKEVETAYRQYVRQEWEQFLGERHRGDLRVEEVNPALSSAPPANKELAKLEAPISLRGQAIGKLQLEAFEPEHKWSEDESALVEAVSEQLALTVENLRLFDDTRQRATREQLTRQITDKMRAASDVDSIIESGLSALAEALNVPRAYVKLTPEIKRNE